MTHPEFAENVRAALVNPRRNVRRALEHQNDGHYGDSRQYLITAQEQLDHLADLVNEENARHEHTCSCGHVHYVQGDPS